MLSSEGDVYYKDLLLHSLEEEEEILVMKGVKSIIPFKTHNWFLKAVALTVGGNAYYIDPREGSISSFIQDNIVRIEKDKEGKVIFHLSNGETSSLSE